MGYILPISNTQYDQYAERDSMREGSPFHIGRLHRINSIQENRTTLIKEHPPMKRKLNRKREALHGIKVSEIHEVVFSELTGKGGYFNELV